MRGVPYVSLHIVWQLIKFNYPDNKVHGANMGPIWGRQDPGGPHVGPMNFAIWVALMCLNPEGNDYEESGWLINAGSHMRYKIVAINTVRFNTLRLDKVAYVWTTRILNPFSWKKKICYNIWMKCAFERSNCYRNVVISKKFSPLTAPEVLQMTTAGAPMKLFSRWKYFHRSVQHTSDQQYGNASHVIVTLCSLTCLG